MNRISVAMTLKQLIETVEDTRILYIGSKTNYFFIGTAKEYAERIRDLSAAYHNAAEVGEANTIVDLRRYSASLAKATELAKTDPDAIETMLEIANEIGNASKRNAHYKKVLRDWVDFQNRPVLESYDKTWFEAAAGETEPGLAIIISGSESGPYWTKSEWDGDDTKKIGTV